LRVLLQVKACFFRITYKIQKPFPKPSHLLGLMAFQGQVPKTKNYQIQNEP